MGFFFHFTLFLSLLYCARNNEVQNQFRSFASFASSIGSLNLQLCDDFSPTFPWCCARHIQRTHTKYKFMHMHPICSSLRNYYSLHRSTVLHNLCPILLSQYYYTANRIFFFLVFVIQKHLTEICHRFHVSHANIWLYMVTLLLSLILKCDTCRL